MKIGDKVKFISANDDQVNWRRNSDPRGLLKSGQTYIISDFDEGDWHTTIQLEGIKGTFNSVHFDFPELLEAEKEGEK